MKKSTDIYNHYLLKEKIFSGELTSSQVVARLEKELKRILLQNPTEVKIDELCDLEDDLVHPYANDFFTRADVKNHIDIALIKDLQDIKEDIFHNKRVTDDILFDKRINAIIKVNNPKKILATLSYLCEKYWDTEYIERKIFLRKQAEKCIKKIPITEKNERKNNFSYDEIIAPVILKP